MNTNADSNIAKTHTTNQASDEGFISLANVKHIHPPTQDSETKQDAAAGWMMRLVVLSFLFALGVVLMVSSLGLMLLSDCLGSWAFYASCPLLAIGGIMTMLTGIHWPPRESKKSHEP